MIQGQPNVTSTWLDGRVRPGPQPGLLAKAWRWMPALLLTTVSVCSYLSVVLLVLFPVAGPSPVVGFDSHLDGLSPSAALTLLLVYHALVALAALPAPRRESFHHNCLPFCQRRHPPLAAIVSLAPRARSDRNGSKAVRGSCSLLLPSFPRPG